MTIYTMAGVIPRGDAKCYGERIRTLAEVQAGVCNTYKAHIKSKGNKTSRSPGKQKNEWCQTNPIKKYYACHHSAAFVERDNYTAWHEKFKAANKGQGK